MEPIGESKNNITDSLFVAVSSIIDFGDNDYNQVKADYQKFLRNINWGNASDKWFPHGKSEQFGDLMQAISAELAKDTIIDNDLFSIYVKEKYGNSFSTLICLDGLPDELEFNSNMIIQYKNQYITAYPHTK